MTVEQNCANCFFGFIAPTDADPPGTQPLRAGKLYCNRNAPAANATNPNVWLWPLVQDDFWCGNGADAATGTGYASTVSGIPSGPQGPAGATGAPGPAGPSGISAVGSFTLMVALTTTVLDAAVTGVSHILLTPTNADAATLVGSALSPYVSARNPGVSFDVALANGSAGATGTETFNYEIVG